VLYGKGKFLVSSWRKWCCFSHAGPAALNSLPASIKLTTDTNRLKKLLKYFYLFHIAFWHFVSAPGQFVSRALQIPICICICCGYNRCRQEDCSICSDTLNDLEMKNAGDENCKQPKLDGCCMSLLARCRHARVSGCKRIYLRYHQPIPIVISPYDSTSSERLIQFVASNISHSWRLRYCWWYCCWWRWWWWC